MTSLDLTFFPASPRGTWSLLGLLALFSNLPGVDLGVLTGPSGLGILAGPCLRGWKPNRGTGSCSAGLGGSLGMFFITSLGVDGSDGGASILIFNTGANNSGSSGFLSFSFIF